MDHLRRALLAEPRGSEFMVGAWVAPAADPRHLASVVFFNNAGYLGMCGHGLIGVIEAMRFRNGLAPGELSLETPVGVVHARLHDDRTVSFENVPSYRYRKDVALQVDVPLASESLLHVFPRQIVGDIAYGGNWFFLVDVDPIHHGMISDLTLWCSRIREALQRAGITGENGADIDHIELCAPIESPSEIAATPQQRGRSFVLCPGGHYDRSPCGTGTSAKVACLAEDGRLKPGELWIQESIIESRFQASFRIDAGECRVRIQGRAFVTADMKCVFDPEDPYRYGVVVAPSRIADEALTA